MITSSALGYPLTFNSTGFGAWVLLTRCHVLEVEGQVWTLLFTGGEGLKVGGVWQPLYGVGMWTDRLWVGGGWCPFGTWRLKVRIAQLY